MSEGGEVAGLTKVWVCLPGLDGQWMSGGLLIAQRAATLLAEHLPTEVVTYEDRHDGVAWLDDVEAAAGTEDLFVVTWGPHVARMLDRLAGRRTVYYAQSPGWDLVVGPETPIVALSRALLGFWGDRAPANTLFWLPPVLDPRCVDAGRDRDIDVLVLARKSTPYLLEQLVPALQGRCRVEVVEGFVDRAEVIDRFQRSRVYLYSSAPWSSGWVEGFGLQPLEARACGATVFSNLHGGLADHEDPEVDAYKLEVHSLDFDVHRILAVVAGTGVLVPDAAALERTYSEAAFHDRVDRLLRALADFFVHCEGRASDIPPPQRPPPAGIVRLKIWRARRRIRVRLRGATR